MRPDNWPFANMTNKSYRVTESITEPQLFACYQALMAGGIEAMNIEAADQSQGARAQRVLDIFQGAGLVEVQTVKTMVVVPRTPPVQEG